MAFGKNRTKKTGFGFASGWDLVFGETFYVKAALKNPDKKSPKVLYNAKMFEYLFQLKPIFYFFLAAFFEIAGCFIVWIWLKQDRSILLLPFGIISLFLFALTLTRVDITFAGRAYAAYGGIYIAASLAWLYVVERQLPNKWDLLGMTICITGALIILYGSRVGR